MTSPIAIGSPQLKFPFSSRVSHNAFDRVMKHPQLDVNYLILTSYHYCCFAVFIRMKFMWRTGPLRTLLFSNKMDTRVIAFLFAFFAITFAKCLDDHRTQILRNQQEEQEVQHNPVQKDPASDQTQIFQSQQEEKVVQHNPIQKGPASDQTQIFQSQQEEKVVQHNPVQQDPASDLTQNFESEEEEVLQNSVEQETEAETADDVLPCGEDRDRQCLLPITTFVDIDANDNKAECEVGRSVYNCLTNNADACLHGREREWVQPRLIQIKTLLDKKCDFDKDDTQELKCLNSTRTDLQECRYLGIFQTMADIKVTVKNYLPRYKCTAYAAITKCQTERILAKCGKKTAKRFRDSMDDMPDEIRLACAMAYLP